LPSLPRAFPVIGIFGPTASGKSAVAEALAERIPAEVVSADSMQLYRGLPILTNQPERPTRLVGIWPLDHEASVGEYGALAHAAIDEIVAAGKTAIVAGGTGLYFRAAVADLGLPPPPRPGSRERWDELYDTLGPAGAHAALTERDPAAAAAVHPNDRRRVVRALELSETGGSLAPARGRLWAEETRLETVIFGLEVSPEILESRIATRTRAMFKRGVEEEVERALAGPISHTAREAIGLDEVAGLPEAKAIEAITQRTRSYAANQRKWLRRMPGVVSLAANRPRAQIVAELLEVLEGGLHRRLRGSAGVAR
jgi:tRNA dimethylallyltransferase